MPPCVDARRLLMLICEGELSLKEQFQSLPDKINPLGGGPVEPHASLAFAISGMRSEPPYSPLEAMDWRGESALLTVYTGKSGFGRNFLMTLAGFREEDIDVCTLTIDDASFDVRIRADLNSQEGVQRLQDALDACERLEIRVESLDIFSRKCQKRRSKASSRR